MEDFNGKTRKFIFTGSAVEFAKGEEIFESCESDFRISFNFKLIGKYLCQIVFQ